MSPIPQKMDQCQMLGIPYMLQIPYEARCLGTRLTHSKTTTAEGSSEHKG